MTPDEERHKDCPVEIRYKLFVGKQIPTPGLFCSCHDKWLRWLRPQEATYAINELKVSIGQYK